MKLRTLATTFLVAVSVGLPCTSLYLHWNDPPEAPKVAEAKKQAEIRKECAAARQKRDQLYRDGVAQPDKQVDVRAACEPDEVARETAGHWLLITLVLVGGIFLLPLFFGAFLPR